MKSFRAALWAFLALVLLAAPACAAPIPLKVRWAAAGAAPTIPLLGPGATWTGTLDTVAVPTDPARGSWPSAKPTLHWMDPSDMPLVTDQVRCVESHAAWSSTTQGGVASVEIGSESATGVQAAYVAYDRPLPRGGTSRVYAWCVQLNAAAFRAKSTTGAANMWARATAFDGTMQQRVIGGPVTQSGYDTEQFAGNYPMTIYPRTSENDSTVTVCASACTFTTIQAAFNSLQGGSTERPKIVLMDSTTYTLANATGTERNTGLRAVLVNGPGVNATIAKAPVTLNNSATWNWLPGWNGIELRHDATGGGSLTIDAQWIANIQTGSKSVWFNGIALTNSTGTINNLYWNGNQNPDFGGNGARPYWDNTVNSHIVPGTSYSRYAQNTTTTDTSGSQFTSTQYVYNTVVDGYSYAFYLASPSRGVNVRYTPPGAQTTATVERTGTADNTFGADLICKVNGATINTVHLGYYSTDTIPTVSAAITAFNTACPNFVMTLNGSDRALFRASSIGGLAAWGPTNVFNTTADLWVGFQPHAEWWQGSTAGGVAPNTTRQNVTLQNNTVRGAVDLPIIRNDAGFGYDYFWIGNNWTGTNNQFPQISGANQSHYQILGNTSSSGWYRTECVGGGGTPEPGDQVYSIGSNNIAGEGFYPFGTCGTGNFPWSFPWKNNVYSNATSGSIGIANGPNDTGNVNMNTTSTTFSALFTNFAIGDFRPVAGGLLLLNQFTPVLTYDGRSLPFATPDIAGNWSKNDPYP